MPAAIGPRFVLEAGFLVLLAVVVGIADLDPLLIVLVMAVGWLLVSLIEYFAWRQQGAALRRFEAAPAGVMEEEIIEDVPPPPPPAPAPVMEEEVVEDVPPPPPPAPAPVMEEEVVEDVPPPPPPEPSPAPAPAAPPEEETIVQPAATEGPETIAEADERVSAARRSFADTAAADRTRFALDPLQPRPRRRWILFGPHVRREAPAGDDSEEER